MLAPNRVIAVRQVGGIGGKTDREVLRLSKLEVAGSAFTDVEAAVDSMDNAGDLNLGVRILRRFIIVTDFAQHRIWLEPRRIVADETLPEH